MLMLQIGFMEFDKRERVNHSCVGEEGRRWKSATLGRTEEGRRGNEPSLQTGEPLKLFDFIG